MGERKKDNEEQDKVAKIDQFKNTAKNVGENAGKVVDGAKDKIVNIKEIFSGIHKSDDDAATKDLEKLDKAKEILESDADEDTKRNLLKQFMDNELVDKIMRHVKHFGMMGCVTYLASLIIKRK